jgi:transcriptional regulator with XRE-family HTH domain
MVSGALLEMPTPRQRKDAQPFGNRLRSLRESRKMTQEEVATRVGLSTDGYRHWEHGRSDGLLQRLPSTAAAFGLSIPELLIELGFVPPEQRPDGDSMDDLTPSHIRRWIQRTYPPDVSLAVMRLLEGADQYDEEQIRWIAETVQFSLDRLRREPKRGE